MDTFDPPWTDWQGGEMPVPKGTTVDVRLRDKPGAAPILWRSMAAESLAWAHTGRLGDIVEYRIRHG